jgi:hypothetical protein
LRNLSKIYGTYTMTGTSLDNLPPELLDNIVNLIEDEHGWAEYPSEELLNMRETCKAVERACHKRFLLYFHEWVIDTEKDPDISITKAVLASHVHTAAIEKITFTYKRCGLSLWQLTPLLHEVILSLASLNRRLILVFDPFADFEAQDEISTEEVIIYFNMVLVMVAVNKLAISSIHVRARREDWDKQHASSRKPRTSLREPHRTFAQIEHGTILGDIHNLLTIEKRQGTKEFPPLLVAKFPGMGSVSFEYHTRCLKMRNLDTFHWHEFRGWINELKCNKLDIKNCNLAPSELESRLCDWKLEKEHELQSLVIADTVLYKETAREDGSHSRRTSVGRLLDAIIPYARQLKHIRLANIWGGSGLALDSTPAFEKALRELHMKGRDGMPMRLTRLRYEHFDEGTISRDEDTLAQDEDTTNSGGEDTTSRENDTTSGGNDTASEEEDTTSQDEDASSKDEDTTGQNEDIPVREDTTSQVDHGDEGISSQGEDLTDLDEYIPPQDEDTTSQVKDMTSRTTRDNEDPTSQNEDRISPNGLWEYVPSPTL